MKVNFNKKLKIYWQVDNHGTYMKKKNLSSIVWLPMKDNEIKEVKS